MPSKRELVGIGPPPDGPRWSAFQWTRIFAFVGGIGVTVLWFWIDPWGVQSIGHEDIDFW